MSITQRGSTTNATTTAANSLACNKPTGVVSGDLLIALVTSNNGTITSTGWTAIGSGSGQPNLFNATWLYKVAGGSEGSSYTFSNNSGSSPPIVVSITAWTGVDTSNGPIAGSLITGSGSSTEPKSVPGCTSTPTALPIWSRSCRVSNSSSDVPTFSASGVTEVADTGVFSGGTVNYGHAIYVGTEAAGNPSSLNITSTSSTNESDNVVASLTLWTFNPNVSVNAGVATATATANNATVLTGVAAQAGVATATAAAYNVATGVQGILDPACQAWDATVKITVGASTATATAQAGDKGVNYGAPPGRTYKIGAENRLMKVGSENRVYVVDMGGTG